MSTKSRRASRPIDVALRDDDAAERRRPGASRRGCRAPVLVAGLEDLVLERVEPILELVHLGPVVIDHRVDDAMQQRDRPFGQDLGIARRVIAQLGDRSRVAVVDGDEIIRADEEVDVVGREAVLARLRSMPCRITYR